MINQREISRRVPLTGPLASVIAVAALGVTVVADNHKAGFGHTITRGEQMFLCVIASLLLVAQTIAYLIHRARQRTKHGTDRTTTATPSAEN